MPPRKAPIPESAEPLETPLVLHSPLSPLSLGSSLYPDGLINTQWVRKHQDLVPAVFLCFYTLSTDPTLSNMHDSDVKNDIINFKQLLSQSGCRTRLAVILVADKPAGSSADSLQERLEAMRRGTGLDNKSFFYIPPQDDSLEATYQALDAIFPTLYNTAVEYYRELSRRARKKKGRGAAPRPTVPPTSGTSQTLSQQGWNVRYDFKCGVFAEFRDEPDAAVKSFEAAYDTLLGADIMEFMPSWSDRWNEARMLADTVAGRVLRCLLASGQTTAAVRRWQVHRDRIADVVERRGHGTANYGWAAWEARWATVMAGLIELADIPALRPAAGSLFLEPEKAVLGERLQPWELMHHTGYWHRLAAQFLRERQSPAYSMPAEDRAPPVADNGEAKHPSYNNYDTYMCPKPYDELPLHGSDGVDHAALVLSALMTARTQFEMRLQTRTVAELTLECAALFASRKQWERVFALLKPLWDARTFRAECFWDAAGELGWMLRAAAIELGNAEMVVKIDWELLHRSKHSPLLLAGPVRGVSDTKQSLPRFHAQAGLAL